MSEPAGAKACQIEVCGDHKPYKLGRPTHDGVDSLNCQAGPFALGTCRVGFV